MHQKNFSFEWSLMTRNNHVKFYSPILKYWDILFGALVLGISRNPSLKDELFKMAILGFVRIN